MTYGEVEKRLEELNALGSRLGLDTMRELMRRLGDPQDKIKTVHVAGTNGKGSVIAYLDSIARVSGQKSGAYTSPALEHWRENIRISGERISETEAAHYLTEIFAVCDMMVADGFPHPTRFETETALAFLYFFKKCCDITFIETGLGGLTDATNIIKKPDTVVLTPISLDHTKELGDTLEKVAEVKCGIIKENVRCVTGFQSAGVMSVIAKRCLEKHADCYDATPSKEYMAGDTLDYPRFKISSRSTYQKENAYLAFGVAISLCYHVPEITQGMKQSEWFGRYSVLNKKPFFIVDGAHNPDGVATLIESLLEDFPKKKFIFIIGIFRDKDYETMLRIMAPHAKKIITIDMPENKRLMRASELKAAMDKYHGDVVVSENPFDAVKCALDMADKRDVMVSFGSLSTIAVVTKAVKEFTKL